MKILKSTIAWLSSKAMDFAGHTDQTYLGFRQTFSLSSSCWCLSWLWARSFLAFCRLSTTCTILQYQQCKIGHRESNHHNICYTTEAYEKGFKRHAHASSFSKCSQNTAEDVQIALPLEVCPPCLRHYQRLCLSAAAVETKLLPVRRPTDPQPISYFLFQTRQPHLFLDHWIGRVWNDAC